MVKWNFCPECSVKLINKDGLPTCPDGHFIKYYNPVATSAAFLRNKDEYLIIKRAHQPQKGHWDVPGGFVEYDENAEESLLREIKEETNLKNVKIASFVGAFPGSYAGIQKVLDLVFIVDSEDRKLTLSEENTEYKWVSLAEMPELAFEDINAARDLLRQRVL